MVTRRETPSPLRRIRRHGSASTLLVCGAIVVSALIVARALRVPPRELPTVHEAAHSGDTLVDIPVPLEAYPIGTKVRDIIFKSVAYYRDQLVPGTVEEVASLGDAITKISLRANAPLLHEYLSLPSSGPSNPVIERIPPGMRAMTIKVDETSAVEGWARSGSIVDVLLVERDKTSVIAEKVKILSAEHSTTPLDADAIPTKAPTTVTILVTQEQCLAINTALPLGRIAFALRSQKDDSSWRDTSYSAEQLKRGGARNPEIKSVVKGYVSIGGGAPQDVGAYALADGKWVRTETIPEGFLASHPRTPEGK